MTLNFEVIGIDDITKSPLQRFVCTTNDGDYIYAGSDSIDGSGNVWKYSSYTGWVRITENISNPSIKSISTIKYYNGKLYAGVQGSSLDYGSGQLWINSGDGNGWTNPEFFAAGSVNIALRSLLFKDGDLYTAGSYFDVWKYSSGGNWSEIFGYVDNFVNPNGPSSVITNDLETDGNNLYAAMSTLLLSSVVMKYDGQSWARISPYGFGDANNASISKLKWYNNKLYAATLNQKTGSEIWVYDGTNWTQINLDGFGSPGNFNVVDMEIINNSLIVSVEGIYGGQIFTYTELGGWEEVALNSDVIYASYFIESLNNKYYLIGSRRKNLITQNEPIPFITYEMKEAASANYFPDGQLGLIPLGNNKYRFFGPNSIWQYVSDGDLDNPFEIVRSPLQYSKFLDNYNPSKLGYTAGTDFLEKKSDFAYFNPANENDPVEFPNVRYNSGGLVYQIPGTSTVILFTHCEEGYWDEGSVSAEFNGQYWNGKIRQGVSFDNGLTFYDCGIVVETTFLARPNTSTSGNGPGINLGGYVIRDGYIYLYYNGDIYTSGPPAAANTNLSVARAQYNDFVASAINKDVCIWNKYYQGEFSESSLQGSSTDLTNFYNGNNGWSVILNSNILDNICFFTSENIQVIDFNSFYRVNLTLPGSPKFDNQNHVQFSEDGFNWGFPERISSFTTPRIYTMPLSISGHVGELGEEFKLLGQRSAPWTLTDEQGGIPTLQQSVQVQPFRDVERRFSEGTYSAPINNGIIPPEFEVIGIDDVTSDSSEIFRCSFNDGYNIFVGSENIKTLGDVWQYTNGTWFKITDDLKNQEDQLSINSITKINDTLYIGTGGSYEQFAAGKVYKNYGKGWENTNLSFPANANILIRKLSKLNNDIYAGGSVAYLYKLSNNEWQSQLNVPSLETYNITDIEATEDGVYVAAEPYQGFEGSGILKLQNGQFEQISDPYFGDNFNVVITKLKYFNNKLYAGTLNDYSGCQVWEYSNNSWNKIATDGFGLTNNYKVFDIKNTESDLIVSIENPRGGEVWAYNELNGWRRITINSEVKYTSYFIECLQGKNYLIGAQPLRIFPEQGLKTMYTVQDKIDRGIPIWPDGEIGAIPLGADRFRFISSHINRPLVTEGTLQEIAQVVVSPTGPPTGDGEQFYEVVAEQGITGIDLAWQEFLEIKPDAVSGQLNTYFPRSDSSGIVYFGGGSVFKDEETGLIIHSYHTEEGYWTLPSNPLAPGGWEGDARQAVSFDNGITFYDAGSIIKPGFSASPDGPLYQSILEQVVSFRKIGDYLYAYYHNDLSGPDNVNQSQSLCIARAPYSEVIQYGLNKEVSPNWKKYYNGSFSQPGQKGLASDLFNKRFRIAPRQFATVGYSNSLDKTVIVMVNPVQILDSNLYCTKPGRSVAGSLYTLLSEDGLNFSYPQRLHTSKGGSKYISMLASSQCFGGLDDYANIVVTHIIDNLGSPSEWDDLYVASIGITTLPIEEKERLFITGPYDPKGGSNFEIYYKDSASWDKIIPYIKTDNGWELSFPFSKNSESWIESTPIKQGKDEVDLYFYIGDSIAAGAAGSAIELQTNNEYSAIYSSVPGCYIFRINESPQTTGEFGSFTNPRFEEIRTGVNTNPVEPYDDGVAGTDIILFHKLRKYSDKDIYIIKYAVENSKLTRDLGYLDWSPRSTAAGEDLGDLFGYYINSLVNPAITALRNIGKSPIFKGGFITVGTNDPTYISKPDYTKEQLKLDTSGLVSGLMSAFNNNKINTSVAKIIWVMPDRVRLLSNPSVQQIEPFFSDYQEYLNATVSSILNLSTIFNFVSGYDPSAWYELSGNNDYFHPSTSGHIKIAERIYDKFFSTSLPDNLEVYEGPGTESLRSSSFSVEVGLPVESEFYSTYVYSATEKASIYWDSTEPDYNFASNKFWTNGSYPVMNFTTFGSKNKCVVKITDLNNPITSYEVRPKSKNYEINIVDGSLFIEMNPFDKAWFIINNQTSNQLFVFCDPLKPEIPSERCTYFGPGIHYIDSNYTVTGTIIAEGELPLGTPYIKTYYGWNNSFEGYVEGQDYTIYVDGGAVVNGYFDLSGKNNIKVIGPGILSAAVPREEAVPQNFNTDASAQIIESAWLQHLDIASRHNNIVTLRGLWRDRGPVGTTPSGIVVSGITVVNCTWVAIDGVNTIDNIKVISPWKYQSNATPLADKSTRKAILQRSFLFLNEDSTFPFSYTHNARDLLEFAGGIDFSDDGMFGGEVIVSSCQMYTTHGSPLNITYYAMIAASGFPKTYPILVTDLDVGCYSKTIGFSSASEIEYYATPTIDGGAGFKRRSWPLIRLITSTYNYALPYLDYFGNYDITVSNIRVEDPIRSNVILLGNYPIPNQYYDPNNLGLFGLHNPDNNQGTISGITFADISVSNEPGTEQCSGISQIWAYDSVSRPFNITFKNFKINNTFVTNDNYTDYFILSSTNGYNPDLLRDNIVFVTGT